MDVFAGALLTISPNSVLLNISLILLAEANKH